MFSPLSRRSFAKYFLATGAVAASPVSPFGLFRGGRASASTASVTGLPRLVMINLFGGFDGLNTVVPYTNSNYYAARPNLAIDPGSILPLDSISGFTTDLQALYDSVWADGQMAVINKVGYTSPSRSHFNSREIWSTARRTAIPTDRRGWISRLADEYFTSPYEWFGIGEGYTMQHMAEFSPNNRDLCPLLLNELAGFELSYKSGSDKDLLREMAERKAQISNSASGLAGRIQDSVNNVYNSIDTVAAVEAAYTSSVSYPSTNLGTNLQETAKLLQCDLGTRVVYTGLGGFDTHENQASALSSGMSEVSEAVVAFIEDLKAMSLWEDTCIMVFSEFGRNCAENASAGTDHGYSNPVFLMGGGVSGGVFGEAPTETDLTASAVPYAIDFRSVLTPIIRDHMDLDADLIIDEAPTENAVDLALFS